MENRNVNAIASEYTEEEKRVIRSQFFPKDATDSDMKYCMSVASQLGLNPMLKEIYFIERKQKVNNVWINKIEPMLGRNSYLTIAHRTGLLDGIEIETKIDKVPKRKPTGQWVYVDELVSIAKIYRKDMMNPFVVKVSYDEYVQTRKDGSITQFWLKMPITMLEKVAESQALRKAFNIRGALDFYENVDSISEDTNEPNNKPSNLKAAELLTASSKNVEPEPKKEETEKEVVEKVELETPEVTEEMEIPEI